MPLRDWSIHEWWGSVILFYLVVEIVAIVTSVAYLQFGLSTVVPPAMYKWPLYAVNGLIPLVAVAFIADRRFLSRRANWTPTRLYLLGIIPIVFNVVVFVHYLYNRHRQYGLP
jgi:hypothetical protein